MKRLALLTAALALTGCTPAGRVPTPTLQTIRLPMGYLPSVQFAPLYVADARGYFADEGLQVQFDYAFETDGVKLVGAGELPFSLASGEQVLLARQQGLPIVYVYGWWQDYPVAVAAPASSGIVAPADLKGKTVGIPLLGGASYIGYVAMLSANHLPLDTGSLQVIGFTQAEALQAGQVDAAVVYVNNEPIALAHQGFPVHLLRVADYVTLASNGIITNEATVRSNPELIRRLLRAMARGLQDTLDDPAAAFEICKQYVDGLSGDAETVQRQVLDESLAFWRADHLGMSQPAAWENMQRVMLEAGLLTAPQNLTSAYTNEYVP